jgi:hypothetical protein
MTASTDPTTADAPDPLDGWTLPASWSDAARDLFAEVLTQRPDLSGADLGALEHACALTSASERLDEVALAAGLMATGSQGQPVLHPAVTEARLARTAAAAILARLVPARTAAGGTTSTERARAAARARWSR